MTAHQECTAHIRPLPDTTIELSCTINAYTGTHDNHEATLTDYAYPGSSTTIAWHDDDRRSYHGPYPGPCTFTTGCDLPNHHPRLCNTPA